MKAAILIFVVLAVTGTYQLTVAEPLYLFLRSAPDCLQCLPCIAPLKVPSLPL